MNKASFIKIIGVGILFVFSQTGCGGLGKVIPSQELVDREIVTQAEEDPEPPAPTLTLPNPLPNPKSFGAVSPRELTNPRRWDRQLQEANSDLHNPTDIDYFGNVARPRNGDRSGNNPANIIIDAEPYPERALSVIGGLGESEREAREQVEREAREVEAERRAREEAERAREERECQNLSNTRWNAVTRQCMCNGEEGYYNFGPNPSQLQCKRTLGSLLIHLEVASDRHPGGTDATLAIEVCPKDSSRFHCIVKTVSTDGEVFERGKINKIRIDFGNDFIIPHDEFDYVAIKNADNSGNRPDWLLKGAAIYSSVYQGSADRRLLSTLINPPSLIHDLRIPRSPEWREEIYNSCILREIDDGNFFVLGEVQRTSCDD